MSRKLLEIVFLFFYMMYELVLSSFRVAFVVMKPRLNIAPGIIAIPIQFDTPIGATLLANLVTLTPGTLTLDINKDRTVLYAHVIHIHDADALRKSIVEHLEKRLLKVVS